METVKFDSRIEKEGGMGMISVLIRQLLIMFLYLAIGWVLRKTALVTGKNSTALSNFLLYVILPCVIFRSFLSSSITARELLISLGLAALVLLLAMVVSSLLFRKNNAAVFGASFSNAGFMGIPLITAVLGSSAVSCTAGLVALLNALQWTWGQGIISGSMKECSPKALCRNPLILSFLLGLIFYFANLTLPDLLMTAVDALADCNAPVAMVLLGVFLGGMPLKQIWKGKSAWLVSAVRLLLIPLLTVLLLALFPGVSAEIRSAILIAASAPVGSNLVVYLQKQERDTGAAVQMICLSTLLSIVTMPLLLSFSTLFW